MILSEVTKYLGSFKDDKLEVNTGRGKTEVSVELVKHPNTKASGYLHHKLYLKIKRFTLRKHELYE